MKRLSVIVPIYNVEPFLDKCLRFLTEQDIQQDEYEIICVNDGSPDNSRDIVLKYQASNHNIILIDQENQGVSIARNNGIERATGKYLLFIDPDDYTDTNCFTRILKLADDQQAQVAYLGFTVLNEDESVKSTVHHEKITENIVDGIKAYSLTHINGRSDPDRIYGVLLDRQFVNQYNLRFLAKVPYLEDGELMTRVLCLADRCVFIKGSFYWRTTRPGSATNSNLFYSRYAINGFIKSASNLREFGQGLNLNNKQRQYLNQPIVKYVILSMSAASKVSTLRTYLYVRNQLLKNNFKKLDLEGIEQTYERLGGIFNVSIHLLYLYLLMRPIELSVKKVVKRLINR